MIEVIIDSNVEKIEGLLQEAVDRILWKMGAKAEGFAKDKTPVDTGRLRNSITFVTKADEGKTIQYSDEYGNEFSYQVGTGLEDNAVAIGTNVEYAEEVENGGRGRAGRHMLADAVSQHGDVYEKIIKLELNSET